MAIAELFLSTVVDSILSKLGSRVQSEYARINGISEKLNNWKLKLELILAVVDSAEERQKDGNPAVHRWLANLKDVAYDMEDLLDHFNVEAKQSAFKAQTRSAKRSFIQFVFPNIIPRTLLKDHRMANEIEQVDRRLEEVLRLKEILQFDETFRRSLPTNSSQPRFTTTSLPEPKFVGREKHMEELLDQLTRIQETRDSIRPFTVLSVVGMGGLGKTTLAQQLYNHESVSNAFKVKAWACVSALFDSIAITKSVLQRLDPSSSCEGKDLDWLQTSLEQQLSGKKFLIVLDDVWTESYDELESLFKPFHSGSSGSRILLTTRNRNVAKKAGDRDPKELDLLSTNDGLSLLAYHAIGKDNFSSLPYLEDVAAKLAEKSKGLPLVVKTIGGLLRFESNDEQWKQVLENGIWKGEGGQEMIPRALKLSYVYLPIHLKRCFAACALFPKDYVFEGDELIQMWIVQGLLVKGAAQTFRDVGLNYLGQLVDRSLLQKAGCETLYSMHDLINDLAKSVVGSTYFSSDECRQPSNGESLANVRHAAMVTVNYESIPARKADVYRSMKKLRTFMPFQISTFAHSNICVSKKVLQGLIMGMKHLRILSFRYFRIREVPDLFGELKLLRYLDFSHTEVEVLPESICDMVELQFLLLRGCGRLKNLPRNIHKLTNLLHLDITDAYELEEMPPHIGCLTNLEILSIINCRSLTTKPDSLQQLSALSELTVKDCIALELDCFPALPCTLSRFKLESCPKVKSLPQDMNNLTSLKHLGISCCDGIKCLPRGGLPPNLEVLEVDNCRMMNQPLEEWGLAGLTSLRVFKIGGRMGCVDEMVSFPSSSVDDSDAWRRLLPSSLVALIISVLKKVERLSRGLGAHLSSLRDLIIIGCEKMRELPEEGLPDSLKSLQICLCVALGERFKEPNGDYCHLLQLIPLVTIIDE